MELRVCEYCNNTFESERKNKRFCSQICSDLASKRRRGIKFNPSVEPYQKICVVCGQKFETRREARKTCSKQCVAKWKKQSRPRRYKRTWEEYVSSQKKSASERQALKEVEKRFYIASHTVERECAICGSKFFCLDKESNKTCSKECSKKLAKSRRRGKDKRVPKEQIVDKDITLAKLYRRDSGKCWICGRVCNWDDWKISKSGYKYPGETYPCRDHVIPISRGGYHSWDNVRLACTKCNGEKSDNLYGYELLDPKFAYKEKGIGNQAKKTIQLTLAGEVIRIWDSTAQIKRELGFNDKRIQEVAGGKGKTAFGYCWKYV